MFNLIFTWTIFTISASGFRRTVSIPPDGSLVSYLTRKDIYRLRRQKEISQALGNILAKQTLPIGRDIDPQTVEGIGIIETTLSTDCSHAKVGVHVAGDPFQQRQGLSWLLKHTKRLRFLLAQALSHRKNVPTLSFVLHNIMDQAAAAPRARG
ncbi:bifunctional Ribosome-binding factor A domain superfamily/Ribosome-binding factor A/K homology domain-like [Babesia duncani]|uniref:Bifunctional Ribosome-binding factor A domain superfamily/Ribosome-binding factor A/K homology domain-like n=1 Tax=Babesia duncani TaxID=323732 RepID=A0AAD9PNN7_9APIC|nr:bifunctional Ribosome-binding factor A domain superfamily/Ribosome-binding factor A/K homology domain-like [Babesia duncani]